MDTVRSGEAVAYEVPLTFRVRTAADVSKIELVGSANALGAWHLHSAVNMVRGAASGDGSTVTWSSDVIHVSMDDFPVKYKYVTNGHRQSPTTRPLIWDAVARALHKLPTDGVVGGAFEPTAANSDSGWVTADGMGAFQLRIGQHPGSTEPLVRLASDLTARAFRVALYEAQPRDPAVPQGKAFAPVASTDMGFCNTAAEDGKRPSDNMTFLMNGPSIDALAFRVDVLDEEDGSLLARGFVSAPTLAPLQGPITAALLRPDLTAAGLFRADFLVVTAAGYPTNTLRGVQRQRWSPGLIAGTLDIGHRGSGASKGEGRHVRENTMMSFMKAATNHSDFIEFDVHVTRDGIVVVHHDFEVKLAVGSETLAIGIPCLTSAQLQSEEFTQYLSVSSAQQLHNIDALDAHRDRQQRTLKRNLSSGEEVYHSHLNKSVKLGQNGGMASPPQEATAEWRLSDRTATLQEAMRGTPPWLGFNIELKYPTDAETAAMTTRWYTRNFFIDAILKVVFEEAGERKIIFSTFDPDCATLARLKQPRYPVFFLTCAGEKVHCVEVLVFSDPRMNTLEAAIAFASSSQLQGVVAESSGLRDRIREVVAEAHSRGLFLFTYGNENNEMSYYQAQKAAGVDAVIMDDVGRLARATGKASSAFNRPLRSPSSFQDVNIVEALAEGLASLAVMGSPPPGRASAAHDNAAVAAATP